LIATTPAGTHTLALRDALPISITAANGVGSNATQTFMLTVDQAPAITSLSSTTFTVGSAGTFTITSTGFPTASLVEAGALPGGVGRKDTRLDSRHQLSSSAAVS